MKKTSAMTEVKGEEMAKNILFASATAFAICAGMPAAAQAQPAPASSPGASQLEELVVTARRRSEALQDVPLAVQALSGDMLEAQGVEEVRDLERSIPGLSIGPGTFRDSTPAVAIRGFVAGAGQIDADPSIPFIINEIPINTPQGQNSAFFDLEGVQVLKGPQGTLQGRNTVGGAVLITTRRPNFDGMGGYVTGSYGNYDSMVVEGAYNVPINETLALRLAARREKRDGTWVNLADGRDYDDKNSWAFRAAVDWRPMEGLDNYTVVDYLRTNTHGSAIVFSGPGFNFNDPTTYPGAGAVQPCTLPVAAQCGAHNLGVMLVPGFYNNLVQDRTAQQGREWGKFNAYLTAANSRFGRAPFEKIKNWGVSNTTTWNLSDTLTIKNIAGYRHLNFLLYEQIDGTSRGVSNLAGFGSVPTSLLETMQSVEFDQFTEELQAQGELMEGRANWIGGAFYSRYEGTDGADAVQFGQRGMNPFDIVAHSFALYGQLDVKLTDKLTVTGGYRYTWDRRAVTHHKFSSLGRLDPTIGFFGKYGDDIRYPTVTAANFATICNYNRAASGTRPARADVDPTDCTARRSLNGDAPSYNLSVQYRPAEDILIYLAHRQGYRAGFLSGRAVSDETLINRDEQVRDVEFGLKSEWDLGGMPTRFNAAAYHAWYTDIAVSVPRIDPLTGGPINVAENSGQAVLYGGEATLDVRPVEALTLSATYGYTYGRFDSFPSQTVTDATPAALGGPRPLIVYSFKNLKFGFPRHTFTLGGSYEVPMDENVGKVTLSANYFYTGNRRSAIPNKEFPGGDLKGYGTLNARVDWRNIMGSDADLAFWVNNLTDKHYFDGTFAFEDAAGFRSAFPADPRTYGVTLTYRFGSERN